MGAEGGELCDYIGYQEGKEKKQKTVEGEGPQTSSAYMNSRHSELGHIHGAPSSNEVEPQTTPDSRQIEIPVRRLLWMVFVSCSSDLPTTS